MTERTDLALAPPGSRFAKRARDLDVNVLSALRIDAVLLTVFDGLVTVSEVLSDSSDPRPWQDRLDAAFRLVEPDTVMAGLNDVVTGLTQAAAEDWIRKVRSVGCKAFARRLWGAATYDQLERALYEDAAVVAFAVRRAVRAAMPFVVAWEDALAVMSPQQLSTLSSFDVLGLNAAKLMQKLDALLVDKVLSAIPAEVLLPRAAALVDLSEMAEAFRASVSLKALRQLTRVNQPLVRKLAGARDALEHSADGVSQAASSLIELIDRILRESFDEATVQAWIRRELPCSPGLTYETPQGSTRPTKRGEVLCLLYAGGSVSRQPTEHDDGSGPSFLHQILAGVVVSARTKLQHLKHADESDDEDREELGALLSAVEGALMLGLLLQQGVSAPEEVLETEDRISA